MNDADGHREEAAVSFGFDWTNDDADEFKCTHAQLIAFAKACERKGMADARAIANNIENNRKVGHFVRDFQAGFKHGAFVVARRLDERIEALDAELAPILAAEEARFMISRGYVRAEPGARWIKPEPHEVAARQAGWILKDDGAFERCASDEPERVHLLGDWKELCEFAGIKPEPPKC